MNWMGGLVMKLSHLLCGSLLALCACAGPYDTRATCDGLFLPDWAGSCGDARETVRQREAEQRAIARAHGSRELPTPQGFKVKLGSGNKVMYRGNEYIVVEIAPPNIKLASNANRNNQIEVPLSELDMMK